MPATQTITNSCTYNQYVQRFVMNFVLLIDYDMKQIHVSNIKEVLLFDQSIVRN